MTNFESLQLKQPILDALKKAEYTTPTPIQEKAIPAALSGRDLIAAAQTGTGKTAAFALPILQLLGEHDPSRIRALILTPTRELAIQNFDCFKKYGRYLTLRCACIYGGAKQSQQEAQLKKGCDILIATPGRLLDFMGQGLIFLDKVEIFVLDEADRMLDMGFIHDVHKIASCMEDRKQTLLFSATIPKEIEQLAGELLYNPETIRVDPETKPADTVEQHMIYLPREEKRTALLSLLQDPSVEKAIVFVRTKHGADRLKKQLTRDGVPCVVIHGDRTQGQRQNALEQFRSGQVDVMVATDVAARGLDIPDVSHVFNMDLPSEAENYIHRIGRTGRAGHSGISVSLVCEEELPLLADIEKLIGKKIPVTDTEWSLPLPAGKKAAPAKKKEAAPAGERKPREKKPANARSNGRKKQTRPAPEKAAKKPERPQTKQRRKGSKEEASDDAILVTLDAPRSIHDKRAFAPRIDDSRSWEHERRHSSRPGRGPRSLQHAGGAKKRRPG
ncbi:MAG: DEAD/DEAH box helicase [Lachnospiraceae bacterium]|jgi:ATP-dependent RNA helicase RhlE|nr:DEAD/DEAH box helicase [Lachnospiraceae bacterium]MCI1397723.1 DEAD/DEAH box helicase [Lachnospiraceae bacterium]MCI1423833.1 DEAD/DEAH box helicase [Lachnospiraceae bacterium]MCI1452627.1 DEAD/DEAH box helicase [Lachnospiraceae bacterium]